jgi:hypothetical protein
MPAEPGRSPEPGSEPAHPEPGSADHQPPAGDSNSPPPLVMVRASSMDSTTLPERARHEPGERRPRRRRSAARMPFAMAPVDVPDDAPGRVELIVVRAPAEPESAASSAESPPSAESAASSAESSPSTAPPPLAASPPSARGPAALETTPVAAFRDGEGAPAGPAALEAPPRPADPTRAPLPDVLTLGGGWVAVALMAVALAALFVLGDLLLR